MKKKYKHLLFDLDHTIWDFESNSKHVIFQLFENFHLHQIVNDGAAHFYTTFSAINEKMWWRYRQGEMRQDELRWKRFWYTLLEYKHADEDLARQMSLQYLDTLPNQSMLMPNALDILNYCQEKGYKMHVVTNGFEETQIRKMKNSQIFDFFDEIITSERSMSLKPHKEIYEYTLKTIHASHDECLMIGDSYDADIVGAQNVNIDQVFYDPLLQSQQLASTYYIHDLKELKDILN